MHRLDDFKSFFSFGIASLLVPLAYILRAVLEKDTPLDAGQTPGAVEQEGAEVAAIIAKESQG